MAEGVSRSFVGSSRTGSRGPGQATRSSSRNGVDRSPGLRRRPHRTPPASGVDVAPLLDRLTEEGRISAAPAVPRPSVSGRRRIEARRAGFRTRHAARTALTRPHDGQRPTRLRDEPLVDVQVPTT
jgi:hypothetical protein